MKKIFTFAAATALAASAFGQNVIVVMKDGSSQKFNADYLQEIRFTSADEEYVEFKTLSIEAWSAGNATLTFLDATGDNLATCDIYGPTDAVFLNGGTYFVEGSYKPYTIDPSPMYSALTIDGFDTDIASGSMNVELGNKEYTITLELEGTNGKNLKGKFVGVPDTYSPWLNYNINTAYYNENEQAPGDFYVKFMGPNGSPDMAMVFTANIGDTLLPAGVYTYNSTDAKTPFTFGPSSYLDLYRPYSSNKFQEGSTVEVTKEGDTYTFHMNLLLRDGREAEVTYEGAITGTPTFASEDTKEIIFTSVTYDMYGNSNMNPKFTNGVETIELDMYQPSSCVYLPAAVYEVDGSGDYTIAVDASYTYFIGSDGVKQPIKSGTMTVLLSNGIYTFLFDFLTNSGTEVKGKYEGNIGGQFRPVLEYTLTSGSYGSINGQQPGEYYVKLTRVAPTVETAFDFFAAADSTELPAGTYTFSNDNTPGTFSAKSYVDIWDGGNTSNRLTAGTITVAKDGENYTVDIDVVFEDTRNFKSTFTGEIK